MVGVLCRHISGIGDKMAKKIVQYRLSSGSFISRAQLLSVAGLGPKTFEQSAGFLRIMPQCCSDRTEWYVCCPPSSGCLSYDVLFSVSSSSGFIIVIIFNINVQFT